LSHLSPASDWNQFLKNAFPGLSAVSAASSLGSYHVRSR
jgi:hypothetical protein